MKQGHSTSAYVHILDTRAMPCFGLARAGQSGIQPISPRWQTDRQTGSGCAAAAALPALACPWDVGELLPNHTAVTAQGSPRSRVVIQLTPTMLQTGHTNKQVALHCCHTCQRNDGAPWPRRSLPAAVLCQTRPSHGRGTCSSAGTLHRWRQLGHVWPCQPQGWEYLSVCQSPRVSLSYREDFGIKGSV